MGKVEKNHFHRLQLAKAKSYIRSRLASKLQLEDIARESGASHYHFIRVFSAYSGETPFSYIRRERILRSMNLLAGDESIIQVALAVGFETASAFNKAFKRETAMTPSNFRNLGE
jgi:AraC-like DNA-binding protein